MTRFAERLAPRARVLSLVGAAILVIGCVLPWAGYAGFPGKMSIAGVGGARLHVLLLALPAFLLLRKDNVRAAVRIGAGFGLADLALTLVFIAYAGGGVVNIGYGGWVALIGAVLLLVGSRA